MGVTGPFHFFSVAIKKQGYQLTDRRKSKAKLLNLKVEKANVKKSESLI